MPMPRTFAAYTKLRAEIVSFDARRLEREFGVPLFFLQGADDVFTVSSAVESYAAEISAPHLEYVPLAGSGHASMLLRDDLHALLLRHVRPQLLVDRR